MKIGNWFLNFKIQLKVRKSEQTKGISSICEDLKHILFLDYDKISEKLVLKELIFLQEKFKLTPFYLFTTEENKEMIGNYHAICLTKLYPSEIINIQKQSHCDSNYITMPIRNKYRSWVLRCFNKGKKQPPTYLRIVGKMKYLDNETSNAHLKFLSLLYDIDYILYEKLDNLEKIEGESYTTLNT